MVNSKDAHDNCDVSGTYLASGNSGQATTDPLDVGTHYFVCGYGNHCDRGQKIKVTVGSGATPAICETDTAASFGGKFPRFCVKNGGKKGACNTPAKCKKAKCRLCENACGKPCDTTTCPTEKKKNKSAKKAKCAQLGPNKSSRKKCVQQKKLFGQMCTAQCLDLTTSPCEYP